jgi:hypothetical protein
MQGRLSGSMRAINVTGAAGPINTYFEGDIVDDINNWYGGAGIMIHLLLPAHSSGLSGWTLQLPDMPALTFAHCAPQVDIYCLQVDSWR